MSSVLDAVIVGGSYSALSAALTLGRARHTAVVVHSGPSRNARAAHGNGLIGHDGSHPEDLLKTSLVQLKKYEKTIKMREGWVTKLAKTSKDEEPLRFTVSLQDGSELISRRVILATGVQDDVADIEGLDAIWGKRGHICPYCDGFEYESIGVLATNKMAEHLANMMRQQWTPNVTLFASPEWVAGTETEPAPVLHPHLKVLPAASSVKWSGNEGDDVEVFGANGEKLADVGAIFAPTKWTPRSQLAKDVGADLHPMGFVIVNSEFVSSVPGLFAVGDLAWMKDAKMPTNRVPGAIGSGAHAAGWCSATLIQEDIAAITGKPAH